MTKPNHILEPEELMAYLDGELATEQVIETAAHLESCRECQRLVADLKEVSEMMMGWEVEDSEAEIAEKVTAALRKRTTAVDKHEEGWSVRMNLRYWPKPVWVLAVAALVVIVIAIPNFLLIRSREPAPAPGSAAQDVVRSSQSVVKTPYGAEYRPGAPQETIDTVAGGLQHSGRGIRSGQKVQDSGTAENDIERPPNLPTDSNPMIVRTAELALTTKEFDKTRAAVDEILKRHHGYIGQLNFNTPAGNARSLTATLRVPANGLDAVLAELKQLGRTEKESQGGEEVTQQYVDLQARLANAKHTEQRLTDIQRDRTGKLSDVLLVETQIGRVRGEIEQMEAQRKNMKQLVDFATLNVTIVEDYKAELKVVPPSTSTQFRNAAVEGYRSLVDGIISILLWLLSAGPTLLVWTAILFFPVRFLWKKLKPKLVRKEQEA